MAHSADLNWLIIRNHNSYMIKRPNIPKPFSAEPNNLKNVSSFRYSGLVHKKSVGIVPADKKGFTVVTKRSKYVKRPAKNTVRTTFKEGPRRSLAKLKNLLKNQQYHSSLRKAALCRASAVLRSQREFKPKKSKAAKKAE